MSFDFPLEYGALKLIAMFCRISAFCLAFPFFNSEHIILPYKILFAVGLSFVLMPCLGDAWAAAGVFQGMTILKLSTIIASEALLGAALAVFVDAITGIFTYAGSIMDLDIGFNAASEFDPSGESRTIIAYLLSQVFIMLFLVMDLHLEVVRIAAFSFQTLPPGAFVLDAALLETITKAVSSIFIVGVQIALPIMAAIFLIKLGMSILARIGDDFPVMILSFALNLVVGIIILGAILPTTLEICRSYGGHLLEGVLSMVAER